MFFDLLFSFFLESKGFSKDFAALTCKDGAQTEITISRVRRLLDRP